MRSADEVGGWNHIDRMGMSIGVTYSTGNGGYSIYAESEVNDLIEELQRADLVVGFNHLRFDYEVLHGYTTLDLRQLPSLDLMVDLQEPLSHSLKLDSIANATFGTEKTADGLQALKWYKQGKLMEIAEYCCYDVKITKMGHEYGAENDCVYYNSRFGKKLSVEGDWSTG